MPLGTTVCHLTSVHTVKDTRIYHKECRALAEAGYDVKLVVVNAKDTQSDYDGVQIINVTLDFSSKLGRITSAPQAVMNAALDTKAEIFHFHDPELLWIGYKLSKKGKKVIYDSHEDVPNQILNKHWIPVVIRGLTSYLYKSFEHFIARRIDAVVTVVDSIEQRFEGVAKSVVQIRNYPNLEELPSPVAWETKENAVCYVGDLTRIRGVKQMVQAMKFCKTEFILGGKFSGADLENEVKSDEGWKNVQELGFISRAEVREVLKKSKVGLVVLHPTPSYVEAIPVKMLEYMAAGIPYVGSDFGFIREVTEKYECGTVVDPMNPETIGREIQEILDGGKGEEMGLKGRKAVEEHFNWQQEKVKLLKIYADLIL